MGELGDDGATWRIKVTIASRPYLEDIDVQVISHLRPNMRLFILLSSLLFYSQASFGTPVRYGGLEQLDISDIDWIEKLTADYSIALDTLNFAAVFNIFSPNATLDFKNPSIPIVKGPDAIQKILAKLAPPGTISLHTVDSWSISFSSDDHASGSTYTIATYFGKDKLAGQILTFYGIFDDTFIKTDKAGYGGWRFNTRVLDLIGPPIGNPDIVPRI